MNPSEDQPTVLWEKTSSEGTQLKIIETPSRPWSELTQVVRPATTPYVAAYRSVCLVVCPPEKPVVVLATWTFPIQVKFEDESFILDVLIENGTITCAYSAHGWINILQYDILGTRTASRTVLVDWTDAAAVQPFRPADVTVKITRQPDRRLAITVQDNRNQPPREPHKLVQDSEQFYFRRVEE